MAKPSIASALSHAHEITKINGGHIIRSEQLQRADREVLVMTKWLQEILKGWYLLVRPDVMPGDSSAWYANFWDFLRIYLAYRFEDEYCLSAENSLDLHTGSSLIPKQAIVIAAKGGGAPQELPFNTSIFVYSDPDNIPEKRTMIHGLQVMTLPYALCKVSSAYFEKNPKNAEIALRLIRSSSELSSIILKYNFKNAAARLVGAYDFLGNKQMVRDLMRDFANFGWKIREENPFKNSIPLLSSTRIQSPYAGRVISMWNDFRETVISCFPAPPGLSTEPEKYLSDVEDLYEKDAYNSLSIEGYKVDPDLIVRVMNNEWNPEAHPQDLQERNALAARGYYEAFLEVKNSLQRLFEGNNPGGVVEEDLKKWYECLFSPSARAHIIRPEDLLGYRKGQVYIRGSRHVPLPKEALMDAMDALFECLKKEEHAAVRAVLGHFIFVYIHPYMDGNGRTGRFLMNTMFASGGYPWTIIRVKNRTEYLRALEMASSEGNIEPFARFVAKEQADK